jgi:energy-coupling factor transporter transmembrane protein EcfT
MNKRYWFPLVKKLIVDLYFFLPTRLLASQIRRYPIAVLMWVFLFAVVGQYLLVSFGGPYLFLDPDYQGSISFFSTFLVGLFLGAFTVSYHLTNYILDGSKFYFLATQRKPFLTFCLNNSLLPGFFWIFYMVNLFLFQLNQKENYHQTSFLLVLGLFLGGIAWVLLVSGYFQLTNKNAEKILGKRLLEDFSDPLGLARRPFLYKRNNDFYVRTFLSIQLKRLRVHPIDEEDKKRFLKVLSQNHNNALLFQLVVFVLLSLLSLFAEVPYVQIPAAASYLMLFSFLMMFYGAVLFWFRKMGVIVLIVILSFLFWFRDISGWRPTSFAFGLKYPSNEKIFYDYNFIHSQSDSLKNQISFQEHKERFFAWKKSTQKNKPSLIIISCSGGGSRSALWTVSCLQQLDSITNNQFSKHLYMITGASGGMIGAAYYREMLFLNYSLEQKLLPIHKENVSKDILNRISFSMATQLLTLPLYVDVKNQTYRKERGYHFENQLVYNTGFWNERTIGDYYQAEKNAQIPILYLTPTIVNDGRKLLISPMNNSFFCEKFHFNPIYANENHYIEWKQLFKDYQPDSLLMTSAIRMNATFPYILPNVELPTVPSIEVMDAGVTDNFGITTASTYLIRFLQHFKNEFHQIIILQIRDTKQEEKIEKVEKNSIITDFLSVLADSYNSISNNGDYMNDMLLEHAKYIFGNQLQVYELQYIPSNEYRSASLSFHLTEQEKFDILNALKATENQKVFHQIADLLK